MLDKKRLVRIGKAEKHLLEAWREGVALERDAAVSIDALRLRVATARWRLAREHLRGGNAILSLAKPSYRAAVSRYYYCMYHAMRSSVYCHHGGDDHEKHSELPLHIPASFPNQQAWIMCLKNARLSRNAADYDPYPVSERHWQQSAFALRSDARALLRESRLFLAQQGCAI